MTTYSRPLPTPVVQRLALVALCAAYIQGPLVKIFDFTGAQAEMQHHDSSRALTPDTGQTQVCSESRSRYCAA